MTAYSSPGGFPSTSSADHRWQSPSRRVAGSRNLHRAKGWLIAFAGSSVLWGVVIAVVSLLIQILS